ncbi:hypothetical protein AGABI1DRAFT_132681 [Agaricus bisporus var. burnettii JB137-S8]|uniref:Uncharacterized protein n=1 Tax=Agaricus bisporus var. burnettii (strain JB137-S8 / ATCC MYA-4627 / FGSC 10392) TaxID=597362 RepID=K5WI77_AGABU|nr:uncharacterized protein AGABI1DRAFT_132681 [Agaricus bisporus var. burnettii JB137-S8]EKM74986.1 hypothetical protein AGABI1DRAFT_132681 [Agaricus bisporus var. burnettii JB137-S8]
MSENQKSPDQEIRLIFIEWDWVISHISHISPPTTILCQQKTLSAIFVINHSVLRVSDDIASAIFVVNHSVLRISDDITLRLQLDVWTFQPPHVLEPILRSETLLYHTFSSIIGDEPLDCDSRIQSPISPILVLIEHHDNNEESTRSSVSSENQRQSNVDSDLSEVPNNPPNPHPFLSDYILTEYHPHLGRESTTHSLSDYGHQRSSEIPPTKEP